MGRELDDRRDNLDDAAIEVDSATGRDVRGSFFAFEQRRVDKVARMLPVFLGDDLHFIEPDVELRLHPYHRHFQPSTPREAAPGGAIVFPVSRHAAFRKRWWDYGTAELGLANGKPTKTRTEC